MSDAYIPLPQLAEQVTQAFQARHQRAPKWIVSAPGRVNLIGEHTDYNDGFVLPMAIERYTVLAADRVPAGASRQITWHCTRANETAILPAHGEMPQGDPKWSNYIRGVLAQFLKQGVCTGPLDVVMASNVPLGGGLSSSAALEVATATLVEAVTGKQLDPVEKALLCQKAEHEYAGVPCGIMDQFTSALGRQDHLLLLDCRSRETELVPMSDPGVSVLIINTNKKHELVTGEYAKRRSQCETAAGILGVPSLREATADALTEAQGRMDPVVFRRARHVISEIERTGHAAHGIRASNWATVGQLMYASHFSLRDDYEVSCKELDVLVEIGQSIGYVGGVIGCRMTGGGFGGCAVALVQSDKVESISRTMRDEYVKRTGIEPSLFVSRPGAGATILKS